MFSRTCSRKCWIFWFSAGSPSFFHSDNFSSLLLHCPKVNTNITQPKWKQVTIYQLVVLTSGWTKSLTNPFQKCRNIIMHALPSKHIWFLHRLMMMSCNDGITWQRSCRKMMLSIVLDRAYFLSLVIRNLPS